MIVFDKLWNIMQIKGISTYVLREKCDIDSKTIRRLKANENVETKTLNKLCKSLNCKLEDIAEYIDDQSKRSFYFMFYKRNDNFRWKAVVSFVLILSSLSSRQQLLLPERCRADDAAGHIQYKFSEDGFRYL